MVRMFPPSCVKSLFWDMLLSELKASCEISWCATNLTWRPLKRASVFPNTEHINLKSFLVLGGSHCNMFPNLILKFSCLFVGAVTHTCHTSAEASFCCSLLSDNTIFPYIHLSGYLGNLKEFMHWNSLISRWNIKSVGPVSSVGPLCLDKLNRV